MARRSRLASRFAPVSGASSGLVDLAVGYFVLSGLLRLILSVIALVTTPVHVLLAVALVIAAGEFGAAWLLSRRKLAGGILAALLTVVPLGLAALGDGARGSAVIWGMISAAVLASIWKELE